MPITPSATMRQLAARRLQDRIEILEHRPNHHQDVDPDTGAHINPTTGTTLAPQLIATLAVSIHSQARDRTEGDGRTFGLRDLHVWCSPVDTVTVHAGQHVRITAARDATLAGKTGTVTSVERDSLRAVGRFTIRLVSDL